MSGIHKIKQVEALSDYSLAVLWTALNLSKQLLTQPRDPTWESFDRDVAMAAIKAAQKRLSEINPEY